jgi:hypothetical protein
VPSAWWFSMRFPPSMALILGMFAFLLDLYNLYWNHPRIYNETTFISVISVGIHYLSIYPILCYFILSIPILFVFLFVCLAI